MILNWFLYIVHIVTLALFKWLDRDIHILTFLCCNMHIVIFWYIKYVAIWMLSWFWDISIISILWYIYATLTLGHKAKVAKSHCANRSITDAHSQQMWTALCNRSDCSGGSAGRHPQQIWTQIRTSQLHSGENTETGGVLRVPTLPHFSHVSICIIHSCHPVKAREWDAVCSILRFERLRQLGITRLSEEKEPDRVPDFIVS